MKKHYETCEAYVQDEFPGYRPERTASGTITQVQLYDPSDASEVVLWTFDKK